MGGTGDGSVSQLRVVVTAKDYDAALAFYRDVLGLPELGAFTSEGGRVSILEAGRGAVGGGGDGGPAADRDALEVAERPARGPRRAPADDLPGAGARGLTDRRGAAGPPPPGSPRLA